ncbi:MAG TPA: hypothetical protein PKC18_03040, partial [Lacipirellulaceae bacterium]|nr:hypothetical protein [Lacipirellulaceae bacterium]
MSDGPSSARSCRNGFDDVMRTALYVSADDRKQLTSRVNSAGSELSHENNLLHPATHRRCCEACASCHPSAVSEPVLLGKQLLL